MERRPMDLLSSSSNECSDRRDPNTDARFFDTDFRRERNVASGGCGDGVVAVVAAMEAAQAVTSGSAIVGGAKPPWDCWWEDDDGWGELTLRGPLKKAELRRPFFFNAWDSSDGERSWVRTPEKLEVEEEDGLKTLRLFLRSFLAKLSAMTRTKNGKVEKE